MAAVNEKALRTFLVGNPKPSKILVRVADDQVHELAPAGPGRTWASIAQTIESLDPEAIEVYDSAGKLARATRFGVELARKEQFAENLGVPGADNETARLTHFANLLYKATEFSTKEAFGRMCELFERVNERSALIEARLERTEAAYQRLLNRQIQAAFDQAAEAGAIADTSDDPDMATALVTNFLMGSARGQADAGNAKVKAQKPPAPNGKRG